MKRPIVKRSIAAVSRKTVTKSAVPEIDPITLLENSGYKRVNAIYWQIRGRRMTTRVLCRLLNLPFTPVTPVLKSRKAAA